MSIDFELDRHRIEARNIEENDGPLGLPGHVPFNERIASQPKERFKVPSFIRKTGSERLSQELGEIFDELWDSNEQYVGERSRIAEIAICSSEPYPQMRERLIRWSRNYFRIRLTKNDGKDNSDPNLKFYRLAEESDKIFACLLMDRSCGYLYYEYLLTYVLWYIYDSLLSEGRREFAVLGLPIQLPFRTSRFEYLRIYGPRSVQAS
jgi:hypothetical protein